MSLSFTSIAETPLATTSTTATGDKKVPPKRQLTAVADVKPEPEAR